MEKLLSVIIPAYNTEKFINKCLDTFILEKFNYKYEVIVVNDGSKDNTSIIAHEYAKKYPDIFVVVDKENGGHGSTINRGIAIAKGKYIKIVDGDDWVITEEFAKLLEKLSVSEEDVVIHNYRLFNESLGTITPKRFDDMVYDKTLEIDEIKEGVYLSIHSYSVKTELLRKYSIKITEKVFYDDLEWVLYPLPHANTIKFIDLTVYNYRVGDVNQSVSVASKQKHLAGHEKILKNLCAFYEKIKDDYRKNLINYIASVIANMMRDNYLIYYSFKTLTDERLNQYKDFDKFAKGVPFIYEKAMKYPIVKFNHKYAQKNPVRAIKIYQFLSKVRSYIRGRK